MGNHFPMLGRQFPHVIKPGKADSQFWRPNRGIGEETIPVEPLGTLIRGLMYLLKC
jgi:hypothetical protein